MRTAIIIAMGFALLVLCLGGAWLAGGGPKLKAAALVFIVLWFIAAAVNLYVGVARAGYSFMEENHDRVSGIPIAGIAPTAETIQALDYPGARELFIYVKGEHLNVVPGLREFLTEYARGWQPEGYLSERGLIPAPEAIRAAAQAAIDGARPLSAADLG